MSNRFCIRKNTDPRVPNPTTQGKGRGTARGQWWFLRWETLVRRPVRKCQGRMSEREDGKVGEIYLQAHRKGEKRGGGRPFGCKAFCSHDLRDIRLRPTFVRQCTRLSCNRRSSTPARTVVEDHHTYPGDARHGERKNSGHGPTAWLGVDSFVVGGLK